MITLSDYIDNYAEIRAVLGVTELELPDETLDLSTYARALQIALHSTTGVFSGVSGSLVGIYDALNAADSLTDSEEQMLFLIKEYALYTVAETLLPVLGMFATKRLSDGKASVERFSGKELSEKSVSAQIRERLSSITSQIGEQMGTVAVSPTLIVRAEPEDRVTAA